MLVDV